MIPIAPPFRSVPSIVDEQAGVFHLRGAPFTSCPARSCSSRSALPACFNCIADRSASGSDPRSSGVTRWRMPQFQPLAEPLRFGIFLPPMHKTGVNPTLALHRDLQLIEHLDRLGY